MAKNQLHQLLAVESDLRAKGTKILQESISTFSKKADHFDGIVKNYVPRDEEGETFPPEIKEIVTTVREKLDYTQKAMSNAIDATISKEETNASGTARGVLTIGGKEIELSAQSLLSLERSLITVRAVYASVPTLDPTRRWKLSTTENDVFESLGHETHKKEKVPKVIELSPATKEHPAQVQLEYIDEHAGTITTDYKTGKVTPRQKSAWLERIDTLIQEVKKARSRANQAEVVSRKVAKDLFAFIDGGKEADSEL